MSTPRLAILPDLLEEHWPSMDLCCDMLAEQLRARSDLVAEVCRPSYRRRLAALPMVGGHHTMQNADRLLNRMRVYPKFVRALAGQFDCFHIVDHSYAHLIHHLPSQRTGVLCHDLDTFRCVLDPDAERRPHWFRSMTRRILDGLSKAAVIFYTTEFVRRQLLQYGIADEQKLVQAPLGVAPEFFYDGSPTTPPVEPFLLHVGSCIPRKRIDILLSVFAGVVKQHPTLQLIQAGGQFTEEQHQQIHRLGIARSVQQRRDLSRSELALLYRQVSLVLLTSEAEGFGLPAIEALACGAIVLASDIPAFREVAGDAVEYLPLDDVSAWIDAVHRMLIDPAHATALPQRLQQTQRYSWAAHAQIIGPTYLRLAASKNPHPSPPPEDREREYSGGFTL